MFHFTRNHSKETMSFPRTGGNDNFGATPVRYGGGVEKMSAQKTLSYRTQPMIALCVALSYYE